MLVAVLAFARSDAAAQSLTLDYQQVVTRTVPGATAAFSLDPSRVTASAENGTLTLVGRGPGATSVVVVIGDQTQSFQVAVNEPPTIFRPGMPRAGSNDAQSGYYDVRYGSDPGVLQGNVRFSRREGDRWTELAVGGALPFAGTVASPFSIPLASYTVRTPGREITLLDRVVANSPLTVSRSNVRGLHLQQGPWQAHAGYSFFGNFEHLLLPANKESVAGIGYRRRLTAGSSLTPNVYYFDAGDQNGRSGAIGTLLYEARPASDLTFAAEVGAGRAAGAAVALDLDRPTRRAWAKLRFAPEGLPSLSTDQQSGRHVEAGWRTYSDAIDVNASVSSRSYSQGPFGHTSTVASGDLQRRIGGSWGVRGGAGYSLFQSASPVVSPVRSFTLPAGVSFSRRAVGLGLDYQFSREATRDLAGHLVRANLNASARGFRMTLFGERETHAPTAQFILAEAPWLQPILDRMGLAAATPQQLADLLRTNAELAAFGYPSQITIDLTPARTRAGATGGWSGSGWFAPQLSASTLVSRDELIDRTTLSAMHSVSYSQRLGEATELFVTVSSLCNAGYRLGSSCRPAMFASMRRTLNSAPMLNRRRGTIQGLVFQDDEGRGMYSPDLPTLANVEVVLDAVRTTRTDASGRFTFDNVPFGRHRVEARYVGEQPTFFTTPSPAEVDVESTVDFGIGRARSSIRGFVRTDAGIGLPGVIVRIAGGDRHTTARTDDEGAFVSEGLAAGAYEVTIEAGSVPTGYPVDTLGAQRVEVMETTPGRATFVLQPYRSVTGRARVFNRESGQYVVLAGAAVELLPLGRRAVTDANGSYAFRNLPAGDYTVVATHNGQQHVLALSVPHGPAFIKDADLAVVPRVNGPAASAVMAGASPASAPPVGATAASARNERRAPSGVRAAMPAAAAGESFTIEVAESSSARHARAMVSELKDAGHDAYLVEPGASGPVAPYHVFVGQYSTLAEANRSARMLEKTLGWRLRVTAAAPNAGVQRRAISYTR